MSRKGLSFLPFFLLLLAPQALAQTTFYPASGLYNGFLGQINIIECENNNSQPISLGFVMTRSDGTPVSSWSTRIPAFGSEHRILNDVAPIADTVGTYNVDIAAGQEFLGDRLNCRTAFYRSARAGSTKQFEYAYALPVANPQFGTISGVYNSIDPSLNGIPVQNWLSVVNFDNDALAGNVRIYNADGTFNRSVPIPILGSGGRADIPLGHTEGQVTGVYEVVPSNNSIQYDAFVVRYNQNFDSSYNYAFPLRGGQGACAGEPLLASTMGNGLTDNWLEVANVSPEFITVSVEIRDRAGALLHVESRGIPPRGQSHLYLSPIIDPARTGNVGSASVKCSDPSDQLLVQTTFYGHIAGKKEVEWSYATQSRGFQSVTKDSQLSVPFNTFVGMANWLKLADASLTATQVSFDVFNNQGVSLASGVNGIAGGGTTDIGIHTMSPANTIGSMTITPDTQTARFSGEALRVLSRSDGQIGTIVQIPGIINQTGLSGNSVNSAGQASFLGDPQSLARYRDTLTREEASHLLTKAAFGGSFAETNATINRGLEETIERLMTFVSTSTLNREAFDYVDGDAAPDPSTDRFYQHFGIERGWLNRVLKTPNPLQEKMAFIWHDLLASSCRVLDGGAEMVRCWDHVELLRRHALGNFKTLLKEMTKDYLMLVWLNGNLNVKDAPDENYGREHWELFSMGEPSKHNGRYPLYTSADITEASRAFTGWTTDFVNGVAQRVFVEDLHDSGTKTLWSGTPYEISGNFDYADMTDITLDTRPEAARFIARRLFAAFAHDHPSEAVTNQLAQILVANNWNVREAVRAILLSEAFFSADSRHKRVKDPLTYTVGFVRQSGIPFSTNRLEDWLDNMGLQLTDPPDVNGWPINKFKEGRESDYFLAWTIQYGNYVTEIFRAISDFEGTDPGDQPDGYYLGRIMADIGVPNPTALQVVEHIAKVLDVQLTDLERDAYVFYLDNSMNGSGQINPELFDPRVPSQVRRKVSGVLWLMSQHDTYLTY